jgi:hypothetical protein
MTEIVPRILKRARDKCEQCGLDNGQSVTSLPLRIKDGGRYKIKRIWLSADSDVVRIAPYTSGGEIKSVTVVLTVAHLDHDEGNHDVSDDRLAAWCQYCHLNYDASEKYRRACAMRGAINDS